MAVVYMDGVGCRDQIKANARRFAASGYYCAAPGLYYRAGQDLSFDFSKIAAEGMGGEESKRLMAAASSVTPQRAMEDTRTILEEIGADAAAARGTKVCVGYCMGARIALRAAMREASRANLTPMRAKLLTELVGTFIFLSTIALSGAAGPLAPLVIGLALTSLVYMGGHVSGAHYNPAVSFGLYLRRVIGFPTMLAYWITQLAAGSLAFAFAFLVGAHISGIHPGAGVHWQSAVAAEIVFTTALVLVVLNVAATRETAGNSFYGLAIGFTVAAGAFVVGPISGAAFNPAVAFGATLGSVLFSHGTWSDLWIYVVGPLAGSTIAAVVHRLQANREPVRPEVSERSQTGR